MQQESTMKRDMDFVRDLLLAIEGDNRLDGTVIWLFDSSEDLGVPGRTGEEFAYHLRQLIDAGLVNGDAMSGRVPTIRGLRWRGHEFLDTLREPDTWDRVKSTAGRAGGFGFDILMSIGKEIIAAKAKELIGLPLGG
jgi:hypothetical protein